MTTHKLLISGAKERPEGFSLGEGKYYNHAILLELDLANGQFNIVFDKDDGGNNYPDIHPNLQFTAACISGSTLWLPTDTEIYKLNLPDYKVTRVISHPCFQNIHSVHFIDGELIASSTGLDNIVFMSPATGEINRIINAEGLDPWHRFSESEDYRKVHSTRPHDCHPNFVFKIDNELWATRCKQEDAVCLSDFSKTIDISRGDATSVHDGIHWNKNIVFTRVDGQLVFFNEETKQHVKTIDPFRDKSNRPVGWCRGLCTDGDIFYLGYSKIRKTRMADKLKFLSKGNFKYRSGNNALIVKYDIKKRKVLDIYETPDGLIDAIYGVIKLPRTNST